MCTYICTVHTHTHLYVCIHVCMHVCIHAFVEAHVFWFDIYICTHIHKYIHTSAVFGETASKGGMGGAWSEAIWCREGARAPQIGAWGMCEPPSFGVICGVPHAGGVQGVVLIMVAETKIIAAARHGVPVAAHSMGEALSSDERQRLEGTCSRS